MPVMHVLDAQQQGRTPLVRVKRVHYKVPSKAAGRVGTRKGWKRRHKPYWTTRYSEPTDILIIAGNPGGKAGWMFTPETWIVTPAQKALIDREFEKQQPLGNDFFTNPWRV